MADLKFLQSAKLTIDNDKVFFLKSVTNPDGMNFDFTIQRRRFEMFADINLILYNVSDDTLNLLNKKDPNFKNAVVLVTPIQLEAGYQGKNKLIFKGTVYRTETTYTLGEKITQVQVSDYNRNFFDIKINKSYRDAPKLSEALADFARAAGLNVKINLNSADDKKVSQTSYTSSMVDFLKKEIHSNENLIGRIRDDILFVSSISNAPGSPEKTISKDTGMILTPSRTQDNLVRVNTVFDPDYYVEMPVEILSDKFEQKKVQGQIYNFTTTVTSQTGLSIVDILPNGQTHPQKNIGVI